MVKMKIEPYWIFLYFCNQNSLFARKQLKSGIPLSVRLKSDLAFDGFMEKFQMAAMKYEK